MPEKLQRIKSRRLSRKRRFNKLLIRTRFHPTGYWKLGSLFFFLFLGLHYLRIVWEFIDIFFHRTISDSQNTRTLCTLNMFVVFIKRKFLLWQAPVETFNLRLEYINEMLRLLGRRFGPMASSNTRENNEVSNLLFLAFAAKWQTILEVVSVKRFGPSDWLMV